LKKVFVGLVILFLVLMLSSTAFAAMWIEVPYESDKGFYKAFEAGVFIRGDGLIIYRHNTNTDLNFRVLNP
jgi:hypothetical protein